MAYNPSAEHTLSIIDYSKEVSISRVNTAVLNAGNISAQITAAGVYDAALLAIILGTRTSSAIVAQLTKSSAVLPTDPDAQRERKWLVRAQDAVNLAKFQWTIPTADLGGTHLLTNSDFADMSDTDIADFVTAAEAYVRSPDGNAITVLDLVAVGRNL